MDILTRNERHAIVHQAMRIGFNERGRAQRAVDTGRWTYDFIENRPERARIRNSQIAERGIGLHFNFFDTEITPTGVRVSPDFAMKSDLEKGDGC